MVLYNPTFMIKEKINDKWWWSVEETKTVTDNKQDTNNTYQYKNDSAMNRI
jgi:hypothetical protein